LIELKVVRVPSQKFTPRSYPNADFVNNKKFIGVSLKVVFSGMEEKEAAMVFNVLNYILYFKDRGNPNEVCF
jgi:hypothetical protein